MNGERRQRGGGRSQPWRFGGRDEIVTLLDLGAEKVGCAIACLSRPRFAPDAGARSIKVLGNALVRSSGFTAGRISNLSAMESCIRRAVAQAEAQAEITVEGAMVTGQFHSLSAQAFEAKLGGGQTGNLKEDAGAIGAAIEDHCASAQRKPLHVFTAPMEEDYDGADNHLDVIAISMPLRGVRQLGACLARSMLSSSGYIAGPIATALSVTNPLQRSAGIVVIDMGAQSTGCVLFSRGVPLFLEVVGVGGQHITEEIERAFHLRKFEAERLKLRYGSVFDGLQADIDLPAVDGETGDEFQNSGSISLSDRTYPPFFRPLMDG